MVTEIDTSTPPRPSPAELQAAVNDLGDNPVYLWSYLITRAAIGLLGLALPFALVLVDTWLDGTHGIRGSLSAYYHSGARDIFVGVLFMTGVFLITYKAFSPTLENALSVTAGIAAIGVALFPTGLPKAEEDRLTPLQRALGESVVTPIHFSCAFVFVGLLAAICVMFAKRESRRDDADPNWRHTWSSRFWGRFHLVCAGVIAAAIVFVAVTKLLGLWQSHSLLIGEVAAVLAFGTSWLAKGSEISSLRPRRRPAE